MDYQIQRHKYRYLLVIIFYNVGSLGLPFFLFFPCYFPLSTLSLLTQVVPKVEEANLSLVKISTSYQV